jgi:hypothetical protein
MDLQQKRNKMKRLLAFILVLFSIVAIGQERTVNLSIQNGGTYINYTGNAADTLTATNQDTIDVVVKYWGTGYVKKVAVKTRFDLISGADTTVSVSVFGKEFSDDATYVELIAATLTDDINTDNTVQVLTYDYTETTAAHDIPFTNPTAGTVDTLEVPAFNVTPFDLSYRYYRVRYIITAASGAGSGVLIDDFEFKLYTD